MVSALDSESSGFERWPGSLCCVLWQDIFTVPVFTQEQKWSMKSIQFYIFEKLPCTKHRLVSTTEVGIPCFHPIIKKESLDHELFSSFRPISNLSFVSKVTEKVVATRMDSYLKDGDFTELFHSTETANCKYCKALLILCSLRPFF